MGPAAELAEYHRLLAQKNFMPEFMPTICKLRLRKLERKYKQGYYEHHKILTGARTAKKVSPSTTTVSE